MEAKFASLEKQEHKNLFNIYALLLHEADGASLLNLSIRDLTVKLIQSSLMFRAA